MGSTRSSVLFEEVFRPKMNMAGFVTILADLITLRVCGKNRSRPDLRAGKEEADVGGSKVKLRDGRMEETDG